MLRSCYVFVKSTAWNIIKIFGVSPAAATSHENRTEEEWEAEREERAVAGGGVAGTEQGGVL